MDGWDSKRMIGKVHESFRNYMNRMYHLEENPLWNAYYNGWLEGRGDMLLQMEQDKKRKD